MSERYRTIVADPPWPWKAHGERGFGKRPAYSGPRNDGETHLAEDATPYAFMDVDEIAVLPVSDLAEPDAHLYLWTTNACVPAAYRTVEGWGFRCAQLLTWAKKPMGIGPGGAFTSTTEFVLFCRRGSLPTNAKIDTTWFGWPRRFPHSTKPEAFLDLVEQVSPGPYVELFARRDRLGWDTWGDESLGTAEVAV